MERNGLAAPSITMPWQERSGAFSPFRLAVFLAVVAPAAWLAGRALLGDLGPRPLTEAIHTTGLWTVRLLLATLAVTPVRRILGWSRLAAVRRMLGLATMSYALGHIGLYIADMDLNLPRVASEIVLRIYLTIGFAALLGLTVLGATSTNGWIRRLGGRGWQRLHRIVYVVALLGALHFFMQSKLDIGQPAWMTGLLLYLLAARLVVRQGATARAAALLPLGVLAAAATALMEAGWYAVNNGAPILRVLAANLDGRMTPALWVLVVTTAFSLLAAALPRRRAGAAMIARAVREAGAR